MTSCSWRKAIANTSTDHTVHSDVAGVALLHSVIRRLILRTHSIFDSSVIIMPVKLQSDRGENAKFARPQDFAGCAVRTSWSSVNGGRVRAGCRFAPSQWETALLCNDVSHWLGASLGSALMVLICLGPLRILIFRCLNRKHWS